MWIYRNVSTDLKKMNTLIFHIFLVCCFNSSECSQHLKLSSLSVYGKLDILEFPLMDSARDFSENEGKLLQPRGVRTVSPPRPLSAQGGSLTHRNRGFASQGLLTGQRKSSFPSFSLTALLPDLSPCLHSRCNDFNLDPFSLCLGWSRSFPEWDPSTFSPF